LFTFQSYRTQLHDWATKKEAVDIASESRIAAIDVPPAAINDVRPIQHFDPTHLSPATPDTALTASAGELLKTSTPSLPHSASGVITAGRLQDVDRNSSPPSAAEGGLRAFWIAKNLKSLDGLPGLVSAHISSSRLSSTKAYTSAIYARMTSLYTRQPSSLYSPQSELPVMYPPRADWVTQQNHGPLPPTISQSLQHRDEHTQPRHRTSSVATLSPLPHFHSALNTASTAADPCHCHHSITATAGDMFGSDSVNCTRKRKTEEFKQAVAFILGIFLTLLIQRMICFVDVLLLSASDSSWSQSRPI